MPTPPPSTLGRVALPPLPDTARPYSFPVVASAAPVVGSVAIWAVTGSPYALVFAILGPVIAAGSFVDARLRNGRLARQGLARFEADAAGVLAAIRAEHEREKVAIALRVPSPRRILTSPERDPERWRGSLAAELPVVVGRGRIDSALRLDDDARPRGSPAAGRASAIEARLRALRRAAAVIDDAPVIVDARLGIGIFGPPALTAAIFRGILVQLANALSPAVFGLSGAEHSWLSELPQWASADAGPGSAVFSRRASPSASAAADADAGAAVVVAVAEAPGALPRECRVVIGVSDGVVSIVRHPTGAIGRDLRPELVSDEQARDFAGVLLSCAREEGLLPARAGLPSLVRLGSLPQSAQGTPPSSLSCNVAWGARGAFAVDLVGDGPHAVVGGTTGSGKSELLVSWVLAMATAFAPGAVNFLLVDFKGGSSFAAIQALPHCVGLITDLDAVSASRALSSLRAELRYRERVLADAAVRSVAELAGDPGAGGLPRLVIVVDEFAAMVSDFPELHALFADIASRGRSLGMHLILCTQRPAGVVRDSVLANCTLRISLRVNNAADSVAVIGSPAAARLPRSPLGRCLISVAGAEPELVQVALADAADSAHACQRWPHTAVRRPWCDPLPSVVGRSALCQEASGDGIAFGLADVPEEQCRRVAVYDPRGHGNLIVFGGRGSGKSGVLAAIASGAPSERIEWIPQHVDAAWDAFSGCLAGLRSGACDGRILLLDDLDILLSRCPEDYRQPFLELVSSVLREGGAAAVHVVVTARSLSAPLQAVATLCDSRLILRLPDKQEHVLAGGVATDFVRDLPPGGAVWQGHRLQVVTATARPDRCRQDAPVVPFEGMRGCAIVSSRPAILAARLRARLGGAVVEVAAQTPRDALDVSAGGSAGTRILVADVDTWQSHWGVITAMRATMPVFFDGCSLSDFRAIVRLRVLPPPISSSASGTSWRLDPDGTISRVRLTP